MLDSHTQKDIEGLSYDILKSSKSWGNFPTQVDKIVQYSDLLINTKVNISQVHHGYFSHVTDALMSGLSKVLGYFDRKDKTIYLDLSQNDKKKNFVKLHECGHGIIPWQNTTTAFLDDEKTLSAECREQFELEANYFASATLFQLSRFDEEMEKLEFGIKGAMALAKMFGGSNHAAIRRYVEHSKYRCSLLVLKDIANRGDLANCTFRNYFQSPKFTKQFGLISWPGQLGFEWPFVQDYYFKRKIKCGGEVTISTSSGDVVFCYDFFDTSYNAFVLFYPKGEKTGGKTKVIISI